MPERSAGVWLLPVVMILYSILKYGAVQWMQQPVAIVLFLAVAYILAVYLYYGSTRLAWIGYQRVLWAGFMAAVIVGFLLGGRSELWNLLCEWSTIMAAGIVVGAMARRRAADLNLYAAGLAPVAIISLVWFLPLWSEFRLAMEPMINDMVALVNQAMTMILPAGTAEQYAETCRRIFRLMVRLMPAGIVMSAVTQYSIGFLWFAEVRARDVGVAGVVRSFKAWRVPRVVSVLAIILVPIRFLETESVSLAVDNVLAATSIFYCVTGLSLLEYYLQRFNFRRVTKLIVYLLLIPTGHFGYLVLVLLGLTISLYDWRERPTGGIAWQRV
ncbi:MAG: DUF2232 domain-containing protein [Candidatus Zixiibacteriota bacterium]|nr:MAG: DUF2232 domain-containing protein [candidate division Zixibacteria bacterium]